MEGGRLPLRGYFAKYREIRRYPLDKSYLDSPSQGLEIITQALFNKRGHGSQMPSAIEHRQPLRIKAIAFIMRTTANVLLPAALYFIATDAEHSHDLYAFKDDRAPFALGDMRELFHGDAFKESFLDIFALFAENARKNKLCADFAGIFHIFLERLEHG